MYRPAELCNEDQSVLNEGELGKPGQGPKQPNNK